MFLRSNVAITGGNFWHTEHRLETAFEKLQKASAPSAFHNSSTRFDPPKCHPNTRVSILEYLMGWIYGRNDPEALILWLYGPAGSGKSAILQTIAECCVERKVLLTSFFFGRTDQTRNTFRPLIATIAYQISVTIPGIKAVIEDAIEHDPLIFDKSIATQLQSLIISPLKDLAASGFFNNPRNCTRLLILIDGLDECQDPAMQSMILRVLANALRDHKLPVVFLIASRPEQHITLTFNSRLLTGLWRSLVLDDSFKPNEDIHLFLTESFQEIKTTHPHRSRIPQAWPKVSDINELVRKSSGQFIYSSVVIKYVSAPIDRPPRRLDVIMGLQPARLDVPFAELDELYLYILDACADPDTILSILGLVITLRSPYTAEIEMHLDLDPGEVEIALAPLASIIDIKHQTNPDLAYITLQHASFSDFLVDISRSGRFYIDILTVKERLIIDCIRKLMDPSSIHCPSEPDYIVELLSTPFHPSYHDAPLTEAVENALKGFSLPQFWSLWSTGRHSDIRIIVVSAFLNFLSNNEDLVNDTSKDFFNPPPLGFSVIYEIHRSSFESVIRSEVQKYYQDAHLTSLIVVSLLGSKGHYHFSSLIRLSEVSDQFDRNRLWLRSDYGHDLLTTHYRYLFTGRRKCAVVCPDSNKHAQAAFEILKSLCRTLPDLLPYQQSRDRYPLSARAYEFGMSHLPTILEQSSTSPELVDFIRKYGEDIVLMPKATQKVINAMHEYVDRVGEDAEMVFLEAKFGAMMIE